MIDLKQTLFPDFGLFKVFERCSFEYFILFEGVEGDILCEVIEVAHVLISEVDANMADIKFIYIKKEKTL